MADLNPSYLKFPVGEQVELTVDKVEKVKDDRFHLSNSNDEDGDPYKIEIKGEDGNLLSITAWLLWGKIKQAFRQAGKLKGVKLLLEHPKPRTYTVAYEKESGEVKEIQ